MNKIILKYWMIDLLIGFVLYVAYRITIMNISAAGEGLLANILYILDIILNIGLSLLYLAAVVICSFAVFLNFISKIRNSSLLSWLSFSGLPILLLAALIISLWVDAYDFSGKVMTKILIFSILYPCITTVLYRQFRKKYTELDSAINTSVVAGY
ncbi:hypothetical protein FFJ24_005205 [Pedobacter sp. KBS0701]|uniref:hypothetical protein n=1 Tax=Pedobacter sp. KBS0701 TaxID=2578106 RepID=UPI00110E9EB1|nr:hypothetical protein [Pedobacter sp. KBS0701]QDW24248.1 hypothetical protein FFJ24_005205 [Pedobacter sp. KBS0701]